MIFKKKCNGCGRKNSHTSCEFCLMKAQIERLQNTVFRMGNFRISGMINTNNSPGKLMKDKNGMYYWTGLVFKV